MTSAPSPSEARTATARRIAALALVAGGAFVACQPVSWTPPAEPLVELDGLATPELVAFMPEDDLWPRASPDGRYVAFVSLQNGNQDVWIRDYARRSTYPLTLDAADDYDPDVSPVGERLVFVSRRSDAKGDLYLAHGFDTGARLRRLTGSGSRDRQPTFAPDGRRIYFTQAYGIGDEFVAVLDLDTGTHRRLSPGPGFDPAAAPDGRHLVYTAPSTRPGEHPHLVALRLADGATLAVTAPDGLAGFGRFVPDRGSEDRQRLIYNRFADDDDRSGYLDADDQASLWRIDVDFGALFDGRPAVSRPFPITDGSGDELFADAQTSFVYFTQGEMQQDILRLPATGMFPVYEDPAQYFLLADTLEDPRAIWFALRCAWAASSAGDVVGAQAWLRIGRLHEDRGRDDLAQVAYLRAVEASAGDDPSNAVGRVRGLAEIALVGTRRRQAIIASSGRRERVRVGKRVLMSLARLEEAYPDSPAVRARAQLERAEVFADRGQRVRATEILEGLVRDFPGETETAALASLRRIDLLGVAYAPEAISHAYRRVLERFPNERAVVREAARSIVAAHLGQLETDGRAEAEIDALRRLVERYGEGPVRTAARWDLVDLLHERGSLDQARVELERIVDEAGRDRLAAARALRRLALLDERRNRPDLAVEAWRKLRASYGDLPGFGSQAREAITRVSLSRARILEAEGSLNEAREAYRRVIDNDLTQIEAHRRFMALSARTGRLDEAVEIAKARVERSRQSPVAHYAYALALTWTSPPKLDAALEEIEASIALNPQLVHAYITRGWIREMQELEDPGFFSRAKDALVVGVGRALGGLLDVEIGKQGPLEQALDDYKTALRLNVESLDPRTEAQILLNVGNGHYRLAEQTNDQGNMRVAFERYLDALALGLEHRDPRSELVFYERLGRAAAWIDEPAVGVMATRRALAAAETFGIEQRTTQLLGNLSLLYATAGEDAYAREALLRFEERRAAAKARSGFVVALRDRAKARLDTTSERGPNQLDGILSDLEIGRGVLSELQQMDRGPLPSLWLSLGPNGTRAQFGFDHRTERDLNLSLAENAHAALGDRSRARTVRTERLAVTRDIIGEVPSAQLGFGEEYPTPLGALRERLGLLLVEARDRAQEGQFVDAAAGLEVAQAELTSWLSDDRYAYDHPALQLDRARLWTIRVDLFLAAPFDPAGRAALEAGRADAKDALRLGVEGIATTTTAEAGAASSLARVPVALTSSSAFAQTASAALALPRWRGLSKDARATGARVFYAEGLLALLDADRATRTSGSDPAALFAGLDRAWDQLEVARTHFEQAALRGADAGVGLGARVSVQSMIALSRIHRLAGGRRGLAAAARDEAIRLATNIGEPDLAWRARLTWASGGDEAEVDGALAALADVLPSELGSGGDLALRLFARSASTALTQKDIPRALGRFDRALLFEAAMGPVVALGGRGQDQQASKDILRSRAALQEARRVLARTDARVSRDAYEARLREVRRALARVRAASSTQKISPLGALRLFGRSRDPSEIEYDVGAREALLLAAPLGGALHLLLVDGSTTAEDKFLHRVSPVPADVVRADLELVRAAQFAGQPPPQDRWRRLRAALLEPIADVTKGKSTLLVVSTALGAPIPLTLTEPLEPAVVHLSAASLLPVTRGTQLVGVEGALILAGPSLPPLAADGRRLTPDDVLPFRAERAPPAIEPGQARRLSERSVVEELADRAVASVVVEARLHIEPAVPERSMLDLRTTSVVSQLDAFDEELPIQALDLPARLVIFGRVSSRPPGRVAADVPGQAWLRLDTPLAARGYATSILLPDTLADPAAARIVRFVTDKAEQLGPSEALRRAVRLEVDAAPQAANAVLLGVPGLDAAQTAAYAADRVRGARTRALSFLGDRAYGAAVPAFERWIRIQIEAGQTRYVNSAYSALIAMLERRVDPPDLPRAAETQERFLQWQQASGAKDSALADARIDLAYLYSRAHDFEKAEQTFEAVLEDLAKAQDPLRIGRAWYRYGLHHRGALQYEEAATALERAISIWEGLGLYRRKKVPVEADRALREVGEVYLNRLSDPVRARKAYERALRYASGAERRVGVQIDLVRVARRRGDFARASRLARLARTEASKQKLESLELSAVIEDANVGWYQGDYRRGARLCTESIDTADRLLARARKAKGGESEARALRRKKIYALSVCGLLAMSQRNEEQALAHLQFALRIAESLGDLRETATQHNNIGRVYLEFGRTRPAIEAFGRARSIDERLQDRYSLAYDLKNLGQALLLEKRFDEAKTALETALEYSREARDTNNELRTRFVLGELARSRGDQSEAVRIFRAALPLAEKLDVKDLAWQIHRALGLRAWQQGDLSKAEADLRRAVGIARTITGRAASSALSPPRYVAFEDLARLQLETGRAAAAFATADEARRLEQVELLDDDRIQFASAQVPILVRAIRSVRTSSEAQSAQDELQALEPRVASLLRVADAKSLQAQLPEGAAVLTFRITDEALLAFWLDAQGLVVHSERLPGQAVRGLAQDYAARMEARADLDTIASRLSQLLLGPFTERLATTSRVAVVAHGPLRYIAWAALPVGEGALVDRVSVIEALHPTAAVRALLAPMAPLAGDSIVAMGAVAAGSTPLPFADRELTVIREEYPGAELHRGAAVRRETVLGALGRGPTVFHFAGHARLDGARGASTDPLGGQLETTDGPVSVLDVMERRTSTQLVVLSACSTRLSAGSGGPMDGEDLLSLAETFHLAGAGRVLATTLRVDDVAAAMVMKRFYRAARGLPAPEALRQAQRSVRELYPHPAWWASFSLSAGG